jgi:uncharacterized protein (TIGR03067 family)
MALWTLLAMLDGAVAAAGVDVVAKDLQAMRGTWKVAELVEKGHWLPAKQTDPIEVVIDGTKMTIRDDGAAREEIALKFGAAGTGRVGKALRTVDFTYTKGPSTGNIERGIYSLEGDMLKFCMCEVKDGQRPPLFSSTRSNGYSYVVLVRSK